MEEEKKAKEDDAHAPEDSDQEEVKDQEGESEKVVEAAATEEARSPEAEAQSGEIGDLSFLSGVRTDLPEIKPGSVVRVFYRVIEGGKERIQVFEGTVIALKNRGIARTVTVRKTSFGIAVERIFPLNSKLIQKITIKKRQKVRQAKLYYLRNLKGKAARLKELR
jgi:large subunit ribosomal protein L19